MLMLTWSSRFAEVGIVSALAGMRERLELGHQRRRGHLREHVARMQAAIAGQERRQAAQRRIDQPVGSPLADRRQLREGEDDDVGGQCNRRPVEVPAGHDIALSANTIGLSVAAFASMASVRGRRPGHRAPRREPAARSASNRRPAPDRNLVRLVDGAVLQETQKVIGRRAPDRRAAGGRGSVARTDGTTRAGRRLRARQRCRPRGPGARRQEAPATRPQRTPACR